jgi:hypothetical protein
MPAALRNGFVLVALGLAVATGVSACGGSTTTTPQPAQSEAKQQIGSYVEAVNKVGAHFQGAVTAPLLRTAIAELAAVTPPAPFEATYKELVGALRGDLSAVQEVERSEQTNNAALVKKGRAQEATQLTIAHAALAKAATVLTKCEHNNFSC